MALNPSSDSSSDMLKELNEDECCNLLKILKFHLPKYVYSHHHLYNHIRYLRRIKNFTSKDQENEVNEISDRCRTKVFGYRDGKPENCTFIGVSGLEDYWLILFTLQESGEELLKCLEETKLIDWNVRPLSGIIQADLHQKLDQLFKRKKLNIENYCHDTLVCVPKEILKQSKLCVPDDVYLAPLQPHHAKIVNEKWPHSYKNSLKYIESCIKLNGGTGLFKADTNELIAWDMTSENYSSGFLYTIESERRKGYGKLVTAAECKRIAENDDLDAFGYVLHGNIASERLCKEIGFVPVGQLVWFEQEK